MPSRLPGGALRRHPLLLPSHPGQPRAGDRRCHLTAIEPGARLAALLQQNLVDVPLFNAVNCTFENFTAPAVQALPPLRRRGRSAIAEKYSFTDIATRIHYRDLIFTISEYADRLAMESDKIALPEAIRTVLLADIRTAVDAHGGVITVRDMIDVNLARKPR